MNKKIVATSIFVCVGFLSILSINNINLLNSESFTSPLATKSLKETGNIKSIVNVKSISKCTENGTETIAYGRSYGCSTGCSTGCSVGCSTGCSVGCSRGCGGW